MRSTLLCATLLCAACTAVKVPHAIDQGQSRSEIEADLSDVILELDRRLFEQGFNTCEVQNMGDVIDESFEFYHDQSGTNGSKAGFIASIGTYVCKNEYRAMRRLLPESVSIFPLYNGNHLYGAIQQASHEFYAIYPDGHEELTDTAKLFTLWVKTADGWKMRRSFSYDHISYTPEGIVSANRS